MSPQRKFMVSKFGKELMMDLKRSKLDGLAEERREGYSSVPGEKMEPDTFGLIRTHKMLTKLKLVK